MLSVPVQSSVLSVKKQYSLLDYQRMWTCHTGPQALTYQEISRNNGYEVSYLGSDSALSFRKLQQVIISPCARHLYVAKDEGPGYNRHLNT